MTEFIIKNSHRSGSIGFNLRSEDLIVIRCRKSYDTKVAILFIKTNKI